MQELDEIQRMEKGSRAGAVGNMADYCTPCCRRKSLLGFLGEKRGKCVAADEKCDYCLVILSPIAVFDLTTSSINEHNNHQTLTRPTTREINRNRAFYGSRDACAWAGVGCIHCL